MTRTSRGTPPPSPRPSTAAGRARESIGHEATPAILEGPLRRRGPALPSLPAPDPEVVSARVVWRRRPIWARSACAGSVRARGVETRRTVAHPSMRSRKCLPGRGSARWSRPPHGKRGVEPHLEGWSHEVLRRLREGGGTGGEEHVLLAAPAGREGPPKELMVRFEGVAGDSSGSGTSDSRNGACAATPSVSIP